MDSNTSPEQYCYSSTTHHLLDEIPGNRTDWEFCLESGIGVRDLVIYWEIGPGQGGEYAKYSNWDMQ